MDGIREWLIGIIAAAMLAALTGCLMPKEPIKNIGKLIGGLGLMLCLLHPVAGVDLTNFSQILTETRQNSGMYETYETSLEETNVMLQQSIIEEKAAAYSMEQAQAMGIHCHVTVFCQKEKVPYPKEALVIGNLSDEEKKKLQTMLETELAIAPECIYWKTEES